MIAQEKPLLIMGPRPYALEVVDVVRGSRGWRAAGFIENLDHGKTGRELGELPIYWVDDNGREIANVDKARLIVGIDKARDTVTQVGHRNNTDM